MTPEQKNLLIAIIAVAAIGGGVYFYNKNRAEVPDPSPLEEAEESRPNEDQSLGENTQEATDGGKIDTSNPAAETQTRLLTSFNLALSNGHKEFTKGNYASALKYYQEALKYKVSDLAYSGMFNVYTAQKDWAKAEWAINKALDLNVRYTEHWKSKLSLLDERTGATFADLKAIYENALPKNDARTAINLVTHFAVIAENNGEKGEAIALWEYAKTQNPAKTSIYQAEINRLSN